MFNPKNGLDTLLEQFESLGVELELARTERQRSQVLTRMRVLLTEWDRLIFFEECLGSEPSTTIGPALTST
jgi:hypothetical protein